MENIDLENIAASISWQEFENLVAEILRSNGFDVKKNFRFKTKRRFEMDVVGTKSNTVLCIDCKQWKGGRQKKSSLLKAVKDQEERIKHLMKLTNSKSQHHSLIVTLMQEDIIKENNTFVVPVWKLNTFLLEFENYI